MFHAIGTTKPRYTLFAISKQFVSIFLLFTLLISTMGNNALAVDYSYDSDCFRKLFELEDDVDLPEEGINACTSARIGMLTFGTLGTLLAIGIQKARGAPVANGSSLCDYDIHPMPYTDEQIMAILKKQGKQGSIREVASYYDKICVKYDGEMAWIGRDECVHIGGAMFCSTKPPWSDQMICLRIAHSCPCVESVGHGSLKEPSYKKDSNDDFVFDRNGNPVIEDEPNFRKYFAKHCNMIAEVDSMPIRPDDYKGIIDDVCNTGWSGYSKVALPLSSGAVQCMQSTMQNIFQKPIGTTEDPNAGSFVMDPESMTKYEGLQADRRLTATTAEEAKTIIVDVSNRPLYSNPDFLNLAKKVENIINRQIFTSSFKGDYVMTGLSSIVVNTTNDQKNVDQLTKAVADLETVAQSIDNRTNLFLESVQKAGARKTLTMFETVQGPFRLIAFFIILLYITNIGLQIVLGSFSMDMSSILKSFIKLGFVYYFALGDAWKEYFYRMTFDISIGVSELIFESALSQSELTSRCNFTAPHYFAKQTDTCNFPNPSLSGTKQPQFYRDDPKSGQPQYVCIKGPFIFKPNYERPYKPHKYYELNALGITTTKVTKMFCVNGQGQAMPAKLINDDISGDPKRWICEQGGYKLEDGYRIEELEKLGIDARDIDTSLTSSEVLPTAMFSLDDEGVPVDLYPPHASPTSKIKEKITKIKVINALELRRSNTNKNSRQYPEIYQFGIKRSYNYVGLFDMMDCKLLEYLRYNTVDGFDILSGTDPVGIVFGGLMVIVLLMMLIFAGIFIAGMVGRIVQAYLVSIVAITILIYFTPIIMPMSLFKVTESFYETWKQKMIGYAFFPAILFLSAAMSFIILDYSMYGSTSSFHEKSMFTSEGKIDGKNCWNDQWWQAPTGCLIGKLRHYPNRVNFLGLSFSAGPKPELAVATIFALFKTMIVILMLNSLIAKFEKSFSSIMGIDADVSLGDSLFNEPGGLQSALKSKGQAAMQGIKRARASFSRGKGSGSSK